jgi:PST family polysaccharide transporter
MAMPANLFGEAVEKVLFPAMAKVQNEPQRLTTAYRRGIALTALLVLPASATVFVLAPEIVEVLLGPRWSGAVAPLQILALSMYFRTGYKMSVTAARAKGVVHRLALRVTLYAILVVGGALIGQLFGISGVALGVVGALTVHFFLLAQLSIRITQMGWRDFLTAHVPAVTLAVIVYVLSWGTATLMREMNLPAIGVLSTSVAAVFSFIVMLVRLLPFLAIGKDGVWWLQTVSKYVPSNLNLVRPSKT